MSKKKKNSNYVTEKNTQKTIEKQQLLQHKKRWQALRTVLICTLCVLLAVGAILGIGAAFGMFDYYPEATAHASITIEYEGEEYTLHMELYGKDAPLSVAHFKKLAEDDYYLDKAVYCLFGDQLYFGPQTVNEYYGTVDGEFSLNGKENKISHKRGTISMARGDDYNSAHGNFFILTENHKELDGSYAAFGSVIDGGMDTLDTILKDIRVDNNGYITNPPIITSISLHEAH